MSNNNATNNLFLNQKVIQTAVNYTALANDVIIEVTSTSAVRTITLPSPTSNNTGKFYIIKDASGAASTNNIVIIPASGLIDGAANITIGISYGAIQVYSDGSSYYSQAITVPNLTGNSLGSGYWYVTNNAGAAINFNVTPTVAGPANSRVNFSSMTADHVVNINTGASVNSLTILKAGIYSISCFSAVQGQPAVSGSGSSLVQIVKTRGASVTVLAFNLSTTLGGSVTANNNAYCTNTLAAGDTIDVRFNSYSGPGTEYSILAIGITVQQVPT